MRHYLRAVLFAASLLVTANASAQTSPVGLWKSVDDATGSPKALIRITDTNGTLSGTIEKLLSPSLANPNPKCDLCSGALHDQPITGMTILTGMQAEGDKFTGGMILDPKNGKQYRCILTLTDDGKKLQVRGFIGAPILGRTQTWQRQE